MTDTRRFTVALLTAFTYARGFTPISNPDGSHATFEFEKVKVFVPRGEKPTIRDLSPEEDKAFDELIAAGSKAIPFKPTKCVEFERAFLFSGTAEDNRTDSQMFGSGFGLYVQDDGQFVESRDVDDIELNLAKLLYGDQGGEYEGLQSAEVELPQKVARFNFAHTVELIQNTMMYRTEAFRAQQYADLMAFGMNMAKELSAKYVAGVYGEEGLAWLWEGEDGEPHPALMAAAAAPAEAGQS